MWWSDTVQRHPLNILWHFAAGYLPDFLNKRDGRVGWVRWSHRGVQYLDKVVIPRKQRPYVHSPKFELRFNEAFEEVVQACADIQRQAIQKRSGDTWITPELMQGLLELRRMGFAHSFETWQDGKLVGGIWGVQIGGLVTMSSMFNRVSNASKAAMARTMLHLKERGFTMVDMGMVPDHLVHFGAEWVPRWKYEAEVAKLIRQRKSISDAHPCPALPWQIRYGEPALRVGRIVRRRLMGETKYGAEREAIQETAAAAHENTGEPHEAPSEAPQPLPLDSSASSAALR
jgi:leucyl/phenylalanyl-tRNA--protein transferase